MKKQSKIVVDTGVLVSAYAFGGVPREAVRKTMDDSIIIVSPALLEEYREVPLQLIEDLPFPLKILTPGAYVRRKE